MPTKFRNKAPVRMGMVGGGFGAFIGEVHRHAAALDGGIELVCGAFSRSRENTLKMGRDLGLNAGRLYNNYEDMFRREAELPVGLRMEFVVIVTPNYLHFPIAMAALERGFHVLCDKPATLTLEETYILRERIQSCGCLYGLTHTYLGYPLVKQMRSMVAGGQLGKIRKILVDYPQGWLSRDENTKQAEWRTDPAQAGLSGCMGDIGSHAHSLAEYVSGEYMTHVCADLTTFVEGRRLDDDGTVLFRMKGGIKGVLTASQIMTGEENGLSIRIYGENASLEWRQMSPNCLRVMIQDKPEQIYQAGNNKSYLTPQARAACRLPAGHPEGFLEAFANLYRDFSSMVRGDSGEAIPGINEAVRGMAFIDAVVASHGSVMKWTEIRDKGQKQESICEAS